MEKLLRGTHKFQAEYFATHRELFRQLAVAGQQPETLFITCSDSRVVPTLITSAAPGELFIVRNVGNVIPPYDPDSSGATAAAIEYAVEVLNVENVIVCGHTTCGAVAAILDPGRADNLPHVKRWLRHTSHIRELIDTRYSQLTGEARSTATAEENVLAQLEHLRGYPFVAKRLAEGKLRINGWMFKIATGEVFDYDPASEEFVRLVGGDGSEL
jgi:carbonic anhydrase